MEAFVDFVCANWRLIYTAYEGHPNVYAHVVEDFPDNGKDFTCFFVPYLWIDLFCDRSQGAERRVNYEPLDSGTFRPGHLYVCEAFSHTFTFVYLASSGTVIYTDYYSEARGVANGFRATLMSGAEMRAALDVLQGEDVDALVAFHQAKRAEDVDASRPGERFSAGIGTLTTYPIVRIPTLHTLFDVCKTCGIFPDPAFDNDFNGLSVSQLNEYEVKRHRMLGRLAMLVD